MTLFDDDAVPFVPPEFAAPLSADRRRTIRNREALAKGRHPVTKVALANNGKTCGDCEHHVVAGGHAKRYHKCEFNDTNGPATDIRVSWPACIRYEPEANPSEE